MATKKSAKKSGKGFGGPKTSGGQFGGGKKKAAKKSAVKLGGPKTSGGAFGKGKSTRKPAKPKAY